MKKLSLLAVALAMGVLISAEDIAHAQQDPQANPRTISTSGEAVVYVTPSEAIITLGVQTADANLERARNENEERSGRLVKAIKALGIEDKHLATDNMSVEIRYKNHAEGEIDAFRVRRTYMITLKDLNKLDQLVSTALTSGANVLAGVEFRTGELRKHRDEARAMAIRAAREKAIALANELNCRVGTPRNISETGGGYWGPSFANRYAMAQNIVQEMPPAGAEGGETLPLGQIAVRATVSVTFDLEPQPAR
ncbi:SIMPL domain-containing protein [Fontivita pretiosa]|uniref:SIMPL domain-containing protein n=1 Tax=Fontivita pretiosa TaxID=2989684 RepID=UPI003D1789BF